ncbi:MAG: hypothetical protein K0Q57_1293 [Gammaproteobacteria bacterium]|nr:hypothetical protein [Gammaproteobacteria bacterium]
MNIEYYVVLPGLISAEMTARDWSEQAISKLNQNILPKDVQCFEFEEEARAYIQATAVEPGHAHCLLTLSMDIGKDVLLTAINGVKRFYAISSLQVVPISAAEVSAIYGEL